MRPAFPSVICLLLVLFCSAGQALVPSEQCGPCQKCDCPKIDTIKIAAQVQKHCVYVVDRGSAVAHGRYLYTAAHLFEEGEKTAEVATVHGMHSKVKVIAIDFCEDLAILELPEGIEMHGPKWAKDKAELGEPVYCVGTPLRDEGTVSAGIVAFIGRVNVGLGRWPLCDQYAGPADRGNSGGGVFRQSTGELVGLLVAGKSPVQAYFVPVRRIRQWAAGLDIPLAARP